MRIHISNSAFLGNIDQFLRDFDPSQKEVLEISTHEKWTSVHPVVLSMIASLGLLVKAENTHCEPITSRSGHYLERMGLFRFLKTDSGMLISEHDPSGRFVPLMQIKNSDELTKFLTEMVPLLHLEPKHANSIRYIFSELVRNVLEHAESGNGAILCAQYYTKSNTIRIGIVDTGIGIKKSINRAYRTETDLDAIKLALMPGITGTTKRGGGSEQNAGAGLFFIKSMAHVNRNFFIIYSGNGLYKLLKRNPERTLRLSADPNLDRHSEKDALPYWQGTVVGVDISLDATQEFSALLELIRDTYGKAVRERKKEQYRKPKFI